MSNRWVEHVRKFARDNDLSYGCALSDPNLRKGYVPSGKKAKAKRADEEREKRQDEEEARVYAAKRAEQARVDAAERAEKARVLAAARAKENKYLAGVEKRAAEAKKRAKSAEEKKFWVFKPAKTPYGGLPSALGLMKAQPDDLVKRIEGLYKNDRLDYFTNKDFKEVFLDDTPKPGTSQLLKIAKYLQRQELGKIRFLPAQKK